MVLFLALLDTQEEQEKFRRYTRTTGILCGTLPSRNLRIPIWRRM